MNNISPQDLRIFIQAARKGSFAAAASELVTSPAYISRRIALLERTLKVKLFHRSTRVSLTERGELMLSWAQRVLDSYDQLSGSPGASQTAIRGGLRIAASSGLGRNHVAPALSELVKLHPGLEIDLEILDRSVNLVDEEIDIDIRIGDVREPHLVSHHLAPGRRILCASPEYIRIRGEPDSVADLSRHSCLLIRERNETFGRWALQGPDGTRNTRVNAALASNHGDVIRRWAVEGHGIMLRSYWDVAENLERGDLVHLLRKFWQPADVWAVTKIRSENSAQTRLCIRHLRARLRSGPQALTAPKELR
ncbi:MAG: LysR family transcriptional regulator [Gammaproteobacteria bacterium]|nr:LysR family transcriptional regulator [Gammaproteobacteria bacterium]